MIWTATALVLMISVTTANPEPTPPPSGKTEHSAKLTGSVVDITTSVTDGIQRATPDQNSAATSPGSSAPATTYNEYIPGCYGLLDPHTCDGSLEQARQACPEQFITQHYAQITYDIASNQELSRTYVPGYCPTDPTPITETPVIRISAQDFQRLPLTGSGIHLDPNRDSYYVKLPIWFYSPPTPQTLTTEIFGTSVLVEATPSSYQWDYGNGDTSGPVLPSGNILKSGLSEYTYDKSSHYDVTLTTTWTGRLSVDNGVTWQAVNGTATTRDVREQLPVAESIPLLVRDPDEVWDKRVNP